VQQSWPLAQSQGATVVQPVPVPPAAEPVPDPPVSEREFSAIWQPTGGQELPSAGGQGLPSVRRRDALLRRALGLGDAMAVCLMAVLTVSLVDPGSVGVRPTILLMAPFIVLVSKALGLYDRDQHRLRKTTIDEAPALLNLAFAATLTIWLAERGLLHGTLNRLQVLTMTAVGFALLFGARAVTRWLVQAVTTPERCIVVGSAVAAGRVAARLASPQLNAVMIGRVTFDAPRAGVAVPAPSLDDASALASVLEECGAERVIIAPDGHENEEVLDCIRLVTALGVKVSVLPRLLEVVGSSSVYDDVDGITLLGVRQFGLSKSSELLKRGMDIAGALAGLLLLAPLFALLTVAVRLDSAGSPLFGQLRIGRRGQTFRMLKFRSMVHDADALKDRLRELNEVDGGLFKIDDDPRTTRVGRFLRRTSLDELPQLINVLRGDMSLVGPRPLVREEDVLIEGWHRRPRLAIKPGMTGLWQIFGSSRIPLPEMVKIDYLYGANWSLWLDLKILIRTVPHVLARRGR
jgi:exopolysaccharide biosynthesis polyprenyl glycosylphosphotransferase